LASDFSLERFPKLPDNSAIVYEGYLKIDEAGEYVFEMELNGGELWLDGDKVLDLPPSNRRGVKPAQTARNLTKGMHAIRLVYIHTGKEPSLRLEMKGPGFPRQAIPAERLSISDRPIEPFQTYAIDKTLAAEGQRHFATFGCANCHNDVKVEPSSQQPLGRLNLTKGCLSDARGAWPHYALSDKQKNLLRSALPQAEKADLKPREVVNKTLVTFNCIACHNRADLGGVSPHRNEYFTGAKKELGNEGRIPPPLTLVGAKLHPQWMREVMLNGKTQREYLATRMPQFGEANVGHLIELFEQVDKLEAVNFAKIEDLDKHKSAGHKLIGTTGLSCIACHDFNGQKAGGPGALDIVHATERVKKDWFYWFLLDPARFHPGTIMPASWPEGHVFKTDILDGDAKKQIESLWIYLEDGRRAKNPEGLSRKSPELRVTDEPVICRGRGAVGYRGIAVGYPERVSLVFDSEEMSLRVLWKGEFVSTNEGSYSIRGQDQIQFPPGIPFHRLASLEDNWPYKRPTDYLFPHDHGYQFRGYFLDKQKRPTFMYRYGEIQVEDFFEDLLDDEQQAYFRRTLTLKAPEAQKKFFLRAATGKRVTSADKSATSFVADRLHVAIHEPHQGIVREGDPAELLIPLELPEGKTTIILDYKW
jgi:mono/diheme cytochrome c family protein